MLAQDGFDASRQLFAPGNRIMLARRTCAITRVHNGIVGDRLDVVESRPYLPRFLFANFVPFC
jgi:hypothetical protein